MDDYFKVGDDVGSVEFPKNTYKIVDIPNDDFIICDDVNGKVHVIPFEMAYKKETKYFQ